MELYCYRQFLRNDPNEILNKELTTAGRQGISKVEVKIRFILLKEESLYKQYFYERPWKILNKEQGISNTELKAGAFDLWSCIVTNSFFMNDPN